MYNKKVLLRERKRHTARHAASARYAGWGGVPHGGWVPHKVMLGDTPSSHGGRGVPIQSW